MHAHLGSPRRRGRPVRRGLRRVRAGARREDAAGRGQRVASSQPAPQGTGVAASRGARPHEQTQVQDRRGQRPDRGRTTAPRQAGARAVQRHEVGQGRVRPCQPHLHAPERPRAAAGRQLVDRTGRPDRSGRRQRGGQDNAVAAARPRPGAHPWTHEAGQDPPHRPPVAGGDRTGRLRTRPRIGDAPAQRDAAGDRAGRIGVQSAGGVRLHGRQAGDAHRGPVRWGAATPAAAEAAHGRAERPAAGRADQRPRHRHPHHHRGLSRLVARDARGRHARPLLPRAGV